MAVQQLKLTRDQFASFLNDFEQVKQFEKLFSTVNEIDTVLIDEVRVDAGGAQATANEALAQIAQLSDELNKEPASQANNSIATDYIDFDLNAPHVSKIARVAWNIGDQTLDIGMDYGVVQQVGQETYARVQNSTGVTIPNGTAVGFVGVGAGQVLSVAPYLADGAQPTLYILGIMTHDLPDSGQVGYCTTFGHVRGVDTTAFSVGDVLYPSPTVAGALTNVKPTAPDNVIPIAAVLKVDATDGELFVRPTITQQSYYGTFSRTTDYTPAAINTAYAVEFDSTRISNGILIGTPPSRIIVPESGLYDILVTLQYSSTNAAAKNIYSWIRKNGVDVVRSTRILTLTGNGAFNPILISEIVSLDANDYIEIMFAADDTAIVVNAAAATAFSPSAPAANLVITQVQQ
jgi:hypothetical protein